jgi:hypothetical protein
MASLWHADFDQGVMAEPSDISRINDKANNHTVSNDLELF